MASSDTIVVNGVPSGSFVINRDSAVANKEIIDAMYKNKKKMKKYNYGGQTNPMNESIVVGDGEALMDNSMVNQYGLGFMQMLNQKPTAHESIDGLIASAQLSNMQNFKGGGYVSGAGNMMREAGMPTMGYNNGGMVNYENGGIKSKLADLINLLNLSNGKQQKAKELIPQDLLDIPAQQDLRYGKEASPAPAFPQDFIDSGLSLTTFPGFGGQDYEPKYIDDPAYYVDEKGDKRFSFQELLRVKDSDNLPEYLQHWKDMNALKKALTGASKRKNFQGGGLKIDERMANPEKMYQGSVISGEFGAQNIPPAWMQPATEMVQTPEEAAAFQNQINMIMIEEALRKAREAGEQVQPEKIEMSNEAYSLQELIPQMNPEMQKRLQLPLYKENKSSNLGRGWINR